MSSLARVKVDSGTLEGNICKNETDLGKTYYSFQGIPYAKAPVGDLRFKAPLPVEPWKGIKDATKDGEQCFSRHMVYRNQKIGSEVCLSLNVYTPNIPITSTDDNHVKRELKSVMVFIHGGAFTIGCNGKSFYGPEFLLREDVVLVTINYRLGLLGYLSLEDPTLGVPGNAGFKDMILALKWVKNNIKNFNGDPDNVTIFGESAGAAAVHLLVLSPAAKGLFHKAIAQSGTALSHWARSMKLAPLLAEKLGIDQKDQKGLLERLKSMPLDELHKLQEKIEDSFDANRMRPVGFVIEIPNQNDEPFLLEDPVELLEKGKYNHVPFLLGFNSREGMIIAVFAKTTAFDPVLDVNRVVPYSLGLDKESALSKELGQKILQFYFGDQGVAKADINLKYKLLTDNYFVKDIYRTGLLQSRSTLEPTYLYEMTLETSINVLKSMAGIKEPGVCHADDLPYLFKTAMNDSIDPNSPEDIGIRRFCRLWANFAKYGNPNSPSKDTLLPVLWKPFTEDEKSYLDIGQELTCKTKPAEDRMNFWEEIYKYRNISHKL